MSAVAEAAVAEENGGGINAVAEAAVRGDTMVPTCSQRVGPKRPWRCAVAVSGTMAISGGYGGKAQRLAQTVVYEMDGHAWSFVHLHKHAAWFVHAVAGTDASKNDIGAVRVLDHIRTQFAQAVTTEDSSEDTTAVAEPILGDVDPMDELEEVALPVKTVKKTKKSRCQTQLRALTMPKRPPCSGVERDLTTIIYVYSPPKCKSLYLRVDCLDWLLSYAADEHHYQGIERDESDVTSTAVAASSVRWDFTAKHWKGEVFVGPNAGQSTCFSPDELTKERWEVLANLSKVEGFWCRSTDETRRKAAKAFVQLWCDAKVRCEPPPWDNDANKKRRAMPIDASPAVAESMPIDAPSAVAEPMPIDASPAVAESMPIGAPSAVADVQCPASPLDATSSGEHRDADDFLEGAPIT